MPLADDIVKLIIVLWFAFAFLAGLAFFFDKFLVPFVPKFQYITLFFMFRSIKLPLFGLLKLYHTFYTLITYIPNRILLFFCTVLTIVLQIAFVDQILLYNSTINPQNLIIQYIYPLWQTYYTN